MNIFENVIARNEAISTLYRSGRNDLFDDVIGSGVILNPSKHSGSSLFVHTLRWAQGNNAFISLFALMFCLFTSKNTFGQTLNTTHSDTSAKWVVQERTSLADKPLIIVDDVIYYGDMSNINRNVIDSINIHKDESTLAIYGPSAVNGVIIIKTKNYQKDNKARSIDLLVSSNALFVIDGEPSKNKLKGINPNDILSIDILKKGNGLDPTFEPINDVVIVVTKSAAIKAYQKKFSTFSKEYKGYLESHNNNDSSLPYIIDGNIYRHDDNSIKILYNLSKDKISRVALFKGKDFEGITTVMVGIQTKQ